MGAERTTTTFFELPLELPELLWELPFELPFELIELPPEPDRSLELSKLPLFWVASKLTEHFCTWDPSKVPLELCCSDFSCFKPCSAFSLSLFVLFFCSTWFASFLLSVFGRSVSPLRCSMLLNANLLFSAFWFLLFCLFVGRAVRTPSMIGVGNAIGGDFRCSPVWYSNMIWQYVMMSCYVDMIWPNLILCYDVLIWYELIYDMLNVGSSTWVDMLDMPCVWTTHQSHRLQIKI